MLHKYLVTLYTVIVAYVSAEIYHGGGGSPFPFPVEELTADENEVPTGRRVRNAEWWKQFKIVTPIERDLSMTLDRSLSIPYSIVGSVYTIAALLPDSSGSSLYILRRRQDPWNRANEFNSEGGYARLAEGAIVADCVLKVNMSDANVISSFGNDTFYYPNAMVRDPEGEFWFSDAARHQVLRVNPVTSSIQTAIGKAFTPGKGTSRLCAPTDVAVTSKHVYVADGHCNNRVVLFNKTGAYISEFGKEPSPTLLDSLNLGSDSLMMPMRYIENPQALAVDEQTDRLYIAESGQPRVVIVKAGEHDEDNFGTVIRYFQHEELKPVAGRLALHPRMPYVFVLNSYSRDKLHRGFTFNTHDAQLRGAWGSDDRGFVRPRALSVSRDGRTVYVADACEASQEKIWIFNRAENLRSRRNLYTYSGRLEQRQKGQWGSSPPDVENIEQQLYHPSVASTKGASKVHGTMTAPGGSLNGGINSPVAVSTIDKRVYSRNAILSAVYRRFAIGNVKGAAG